MTTINIGNVLLQDYEPSKDEPSEKSQDEINQLRDRCLKLDHQQTMLIEEIANLKKDFAEMLQKSKDEYIAALQCEMEITRHYLIKEIYRKEFSYSKGSHGDPLSKF